MHDGAPCHSTKIVSEFLKSKKIGILNIHSPDINPSENLRSMLMKQVADKQPSSATDLGQIIKEVWVREISSAYCRSLIESMPKTVVKNKGGHTKY